MNATDTEILNRALPKWPQMKVRGKSVTIEQAKEIIRRTDTLLTRGYGGNNRRFNVWAFDKIGYPHDEDRRISDSDPDRMKKIRAIWDQQAEWREKWGAIETEYVYNSWASSSFVNGPAGWCHPDGTISFVYNVGKWPSGDAVFDDWVKLARAFPSLELAVVLMSGEECETGTQPVIGFEIQQGEVRVVDPTLSDPLAQYGEPHPAVELNLAVMNLIRNPDREQGLPNAWFEEWAKYSALW